MDAKCHSLTASYIRERHSYDDTTPICQFYEGFNLDGKETTMPFGVYNIDDMKQFGRDRNWCPYFLARFAVGFLLYKTMKNMGNVAFLDHLCKHCGLQLPLYTRSKNC